MAGGPSFNYGGKQNVPFQNFNRGNNHRQDRSQKQQLQQARNNYQKQNQIHHVQGQGSASKQKGKKAFVNVQYIHDAIPGIYDRLQSPIFGGSRADSIKGDRKKKKGRKHNSDNGIPQQSSSQRAMTQKSNNYENINAEFSMDIDEETISQPTNPFTRPPPRNIIYVNPNVLKAYNPLPKRECRLDHELMDFLIGTNKYNEAYANLWDIDWSFWMEAETKWMSWKVTHPYETEIPSEVLDQLFREGKLKGEEHWKSGSGSYHSPSFSNSSFSRSFTLPAASSWKVNTDKDSRDGWYGNTALNASQLTQYSQYSSFKNDSSFVQQQNDVDVEMIDAPSNPHSLFVKQHINSGNAYSASGSPTGPWRWGSPPTSLHGNNRSSNIYNSLNLGAAHFSPNSQHFAVLPVEMEIDNPKIDLKSVGDPTLVPPQGQPFSCQQSQLPQIQIHPATPPGKLFTPPYPAARPHHQSQPQFLVPAAPTDPIPAPRSLFSMFQTPQKTEEQKKADIEEAKKQMAKIMCPENLPYSQQKFSSMGTKPLDFGSLNKAEEKKKKEKSERSLRRAIYRNL